MVEIGSSEMPDPEQAVSRDLPLRLFHWGLAVAVVTNVVTANIGRMDLRAFGTNRSGACRVSCHLGVCWRAPCQICQFRPHALDGVCLAMVPTDRDRPAGGSFAIGGALGAGIAGYHGFRR